jgi:hypothetical protein
MNDIVKYNEVCDKKFNNMFCNICNGKGMYRPMWLEIREDTKWKVESSIDSIRSSIIDLLYEY